MLKFLLIYYGLYLISIIIFGGMLGIKLFRKDYDEGIVYYGMYKTYAVKYRGISFVIFNIYAIIFWPLEIIRFIKNFNRFFEICDKLQEESE